MTTIAHDRQIRRTDAADQAGSGRQALFAILLAVAAIAVFAVLILGPALPVGATIVLAVLSISLVCLGWAIAGLRL